MGRLGLPSALLWLAFGFALGSPSALLWLAFGFALGLPSALLLACLEMVAGAWYGPKYGVGYV